MFLDEHTTSGSLVYGLTNKARCLAAQVGDLDNVRFLVGTLCLKEENEVHLIEVYEEERDVKCLNIFTHPSEIWFLSPCPSNPDLFFTCYNSNTNNIPQFKASLWKMNTGTNALQHITELKGHIGDIKGVYWNPSETETSESIVSLDENNIRYWKLEGSSTKEIGSVSIGELHKIITGCWNPIHPEQFATANDNSVRGWDLRTLKETYNIPMAHTPFVRDLDFNSNRDYYLVTGGDDYRIKFWDIRKVDQPVKSVPAHSHWVWNVKYNPFHDQLLLSSSTDCTVNLWNMPSISSAPGVDDGSNKSRDHLVKTFEEHEDSVYSIAWGASGWSFASLSYDGRIVVNEVPREYSDFF